MKITDLKIGDIVCDKTAKFPMVVVGLFSTLNADPNKGTVYLDFDGNEGDMWEENIEDLSLC
jgi:hypothetical protein